MYSMYYCVNTVIISCGNEGLAGARGRGARGHAPWGSAYERGTLLAGSGLWGLKPLVERAGARTDPIYPSEACARAPDGVRFLHARPKARW